MGNSPHKVGSDPPRLQSQALTTTHYHVPTVVLVSTPPSYPPLSMTVCVSTRRLYCRCTNLRSSRTTKRLRKTTGRRLCPATSSWWGCKVCLGSRQPAQLP